MITFKFLTLLMMISCGTTKKAPSDDLPDWLGKTREEVKEAFNHLTPRTEENMISYRDADRMPSPGRCAVIPCWPVLAKDRIDCRYVFEFENDRVVKATRSGNCRDKIKTESGQ